jgi:hypothetical protein
MMRKATGPLTSKGLQNEKELGRKWNKGLRYALLDFESGKKWTLLAEALETPIRGTRHQI